MWYWQTRFATKGHNTYDWVCIICFYDTVQTVQNSTVWDESRSGSWCATVADASGITSVGYLDSSTGCCTSALKKEAEEGEVINFSFSTTLSNDRIYNLGLNKTSHCEIMSYWFITGSVDLTQSGCLHTLRTLRKHKVKECFTKNVY